MPQYADFHRPAYRDPRWLETHWFGFFVPEVGMRCHMRAAFRTNLDVALSFVVIYSQSGSVLDIDFFESQMHLPVGTARLSDFSLANGLSMKGHPAPDRYTVTYRSRCGRVAIEAEYEALMPPLESKDQIIGDDAGFAAFHRPSASDVTTGHVDQTFAVTGRLRIDDEEYTIDCVSNHDHSWSPRAEWKNLCGTFDQFHFGREMTLATQAVERRWNEPQVTHGYLLLGSEVRSLTSATVEYERDGLLTTRMRYRVTDAAGEDHEVSATLPSCAHLDTGSNGLTVMNLGDAEWRGRRGYSECMWHADVPGQIQRAVRRARQKDPSATLASIFTDGVWD